MPMVLSRADHALLSLIQNDASRSHAELAEDAGMSRSTCWRRMSELEQAGVILRRVALLEARALGLTLFALTSVAMREHSDKVRLAFESFLERAANVLEAYSTSGNWDYLLIVAARDMDAYDAWLNGALLRHASVRTTSTSFALRRVKYSTALPLGKD
ncbi:MAG: Lrp/AsnC family transcriptional regulator [Hyphomonadaceae bacterium]